MERQGQSSVTTWWLFCVTTKPVMGNYSITDAAADLMRVCVKVPVSFSKVAGVSARCNAVPLEPVLGGCPPHPRAIDPFTHTHTIALSVVSARGAGAHMCNRLCWLSVVVYHWSCQTLRPWPPQRYLRGPHSVRRLFLGGLLAVFQQLWDSLPRLSRPGSKRILIVSAQRPRIFPCVAMCVR